MIPKHGEGEHVAETQVIRLERPTPAPRAPQPRPHRRPQPAPPAAAPPPHELARIVPSAPPQPPKRHHANVLATRIATDASVYAREVAKLNAGNNPTAIPTIDPATRQSASKNFGMQLPDGTNVASAGNGLITTTRRWRDHGLDCYYGHYEYTYGNGTTESADIAWPFCYQPSNDPFLRLPHPIPMPLPIAGYRVPPGTQLPPLERDVYQHWLADGG